MHGVDRQRRTELHADLGLMDVIRLLFELLHGELGVVDVHPRPVEAEFQHTEKRFPVQVVGLAPAHRSSEIAPELPAVGPVGERLPDIAEVEILGAALPDGAVQFGRLRLFHTRRECVHDLLQGVQPRLILLSVYPGRNKDQKDAD